MIMPPDTGPASDGGKQPRLSKFIGKIADIEAADLTDQQLRAARKLAAKRGIAASSDLDAVQQLKALVARGKTRAEKPARSKPGNAPPPAPGEQFDLLREIEGELVSRRRARLRRMLLRVALFVLAPALLATGYFTFYATPMYATYTEMVIQKPDGANAATGIGLLAAFPQATTQESASVQGYLSSRAAMLELMRTQGYRASLDDPRIDIIQRLPAEASNEDAYRRYAKRVRIGFDPNDNVVKMEVIAPEPDQALRYANALIGLAEDQVDRMSQRLRADRMRGARDTYEAAEARLSEAQARVLRLQQERGVLSPGQEAGTRMAQIAALENAVLEKRLVLAEMGDSTGIEAGRSGVMENSIARLEAMIGELRGGLTEGDADVASLARVGSELLAAQAELELRREMLSQSVQLLEAARIEANRQSIYLATSVAPVLPDEAAYPKALQNSALAFLVLAGVYLTISLTFSVLREQISA